MIWTVKDQTKYTCQGHLSFYVTGNRGLDLVKELGYTISNYYLLLYLYPFPKKSYDQSDFILSYSSGFIGNISLHLSSPLKTKMSFYTGNPIYSRKTCTHNHQEGGRYSVFIFERDLEPRLELRYIK